jgi:hypothetical protein
MGRYVSNDLGSRTWRFPFIGRLFPNKVSHNFSIQVKEMDQKCIRGLNFDTVGGKSIRRKILGVLGHNNGSMGQYSRGQNVPYPWDHFSSHQQGISVACKTTQGMLF